LTSIVYIGYTSGTTVAPESVIKEMFSRYGEVLTITIKQTPKDNSAKSYVLVEMASLVIIYILHLIRLGRGKNCKKENLLNG
jgi:hypothetical protein